MKKSFITPGPDLDPNCLQRLSACNNTLSEYDNQIKLTNCPGVCQLILVSAGHSLIGTLF